MKKFMTLAAMFAAVMVSFSSCEKDNGGNDEGGNNNGGGTTEVCPDCGENPCVCYNAPITIDGDFSDWDSVNAAVAYCDPEAKYTALTTFKCYADDVYVFVYFEFVDDEIVDRAWTPFHVYLDADGSNTTGGFGDQWTNAYCEWNLEGAVMSEDAFCSYDPGLYSWTGEPGGEGWLWSDPAVLSSGSGIGTGAGNGNKYEFSLMREMLMGVEFADTFGIGVDIQQSWSSVGVLPNTAITDDNAAGKADLLQVTIAK